MEAEFPTANATELFCIMLQDRVSRLEDELRELQLRCVPAKNFEITRYPAGYFLRLHLTVGGWPVTTTGQRKLCAKFFKCLRYCCNIETAHAFLCFCVYHTPESSVLEGVLNTTSHEIMPARIAAAFEQGWKEILAKTKHRVNEICPILCESLARAIHVANQRAVEFHIQEEVTRELNVPDCMDVTVELVECKSSINPYLFQNPTIHHLFPAVFWKTTGLTDARRKLCS